MSRVFISHAQQDSATVSEIAKGVEAAGFKTWYYARDSVPGLPYLAQVGEAIDQSDAVLLVISDASLGSNQVTGEVVRAHESGKPFLPVLVDVSHAEFQRRQPTWRQALGAATSVNIPGGGVSVILPRILTGLMALLPDSSSLKPDGNQQPCRGPSRRARRMWICAAVALAIGLLVWSGYQRWPAGLLGVRRTESLPFTVGYLISRAQWAAAGATLFCRGGASGCEFLLSASGSPMNPDPFVNAIDALSRKDGWPSSHFVQRLKDLLGADPLRMGLQQDTAPQTRTGDPASDREAAANALGKMVDQLSAELLTGTLEAGRNADAGMFFAGLQVGRIDGALSHSRYSRNPQAQQAAVVVCRHALNAMMTAFRQPGYDLDRKLHPVLDQFPGLTSRLDSAGVDEVAAFARSARKRFLNGAVLLSLKD